MSGACPLLGFVVEFDLQPGLPEERSLALFDDFNAIIEQRGLVCVGGGSPSHWSHTVHSEASQATDADRQAVERWASSRQEIAAVRSTAIMDLDSTA